MMKFISIGLLSILVLIGCKTVGPVLVIEKNFSPRDVRVSDVTITGHHIEANNLNLYIEYEGKCKDHSFQLKSNGLFLKSNPPKLHTYLVHQMNNKTCTDIVKDTISFDISNSKYSDSNENNVVTLIVYGYSTPIKYTY